MKSAGKPARSFHCVPDRGDQRASVTGTAVYSLQALFRQAPLVPAQTAEERIFTAPVYGHRNEGSRGPGTGLRTCGWQGPGTGGPPVLGAAAWPPGPPEPICFSASTPSCKVRTRKASGEKTWLA